MSEPKFNMQTEPDFLPFADWSVKNDSGDRIENRKNYADYVRGEYVEAGLYNDQAEFNIRDNTLNAAVADGSVDPEDTTSVGLLFERADVSLEDKMNLVRDSLNHKDVSWQAVNSLRAFNEYYETREIPSEEIRETGERYLAEVNSTIDEGYAAAVRASVFNGESPLGRVKNADGDFEIIVSPNFDKSNISAAIRASKKGGISYADAAAVQSVVDNPIGFNRPFYEIKRLIDVTTQIEGLAKDFPRSQTARIIQDLATHVAYVDKKGKPVSYDLERRASIINSELREKNLLPDGQSFTEEDLIDAITQIGYNTANGSGQLKVYTDPEKAYKNVRSVGFMPPLIPAIVLTNDELYTNSVTNNNFITQDTKTTLDAMREPAIEANFNQMSKILSSSSISDEWLNAVQSGRVAGKTNSVILREFTADSDNFNEVSDRISSVAYSVRDGFLDLVMSVPTMMGKEWARDSMSARYKERNARREVAQVMGANYGIGQDIAETIAPMVIDMAATAVLAKATVPLAGAGGAAYLAARQGARLTAKGALKSITSNALRQLPNELPEVAAQRLVTQNLIRSSVSSKGVDGAMAVIKGFNNLAAARYVGVLPALVIPAANRSGGATYIAVYNALEGDKTITPEERHDRALGAGLAGGAITGLIVGAFGALGRSGLDGALLSGASRSQVKGIITRLANVDDISDAVFSRVVAKQVAETMKKQVSFGFARQVGKNAIDEAAEEGLDAFLNVFVTDAYTDENTPFLEKLQQAGHGALIGAALGSAVPVIRAAKNKVSKAADISSDMSVEIDFAKGISDKLAASGSPITAQTVYNILSAPRRSRAPIAQAILDASRSVDPTGTDAPDAASPADVDKAAAAVIAELNKNVSPESVAQAVYDETGQGRFEYVDDILPNEVARRGRKTRKRKSPAEREMEFDFSGPTTDQAQMQLDLGLDTSASDKPKVRTAREARSSKNTAKSRLAERLDLDFDSTSNNEKNNHADTSQSVEDLTDAERDEIEIELQEELNQGVERTTPTMLGSSVTKPATKAPVVKRGTKKPAQEPDAEPMFSLDEFIDDELIGREVSAMTKLAMFGSPVRFQRNALYGLPQRKTYPEGYLAGKADLLARKINETYPVIGFGTASDRIVGKDKVSFFDPKSNKVTRRAPIGYIDTDGVGIFTNDPVTVKVLLDRHIPVVIPADFTARINPSFRVYTSGGVRFVNDIVTVNPQTGTGFVSTVTRQAKVKLSEPNYKYYTDLSKFIALFNPEVFERSVPNPKGVVGEVTLREIILDADQLYTAYSSNRPNSAYGDPGKARNTLLGILKPKQGNLDTDFFEAAAPAFIMAVRKEALLYELRVGMQKFSDQKADLKLSKIEEAVSDFVARTKTGKATVARNLADVFGSDVSPETQPDLVIQRFIENEILIRKPFMATYREIGAKVGNAFAMQQRERSTFLRNALFETTDPTDLSKIQDDNDIFDPEAESSDNTFIAPSESYPGSDPLVVSRVIQEAAFDVADALDGDPEMRGAVDKLLAETVFQGNSGIDVTMFSSTDAFGMLASWMASGNYNTNPDALRFQRELRDGVYENGEKIRVPLKLMYLSSKTIEGDPTKDTAYIESIRENLARSFGRVVTKREASDFVRSIGGAMQKLWSRSYVRGEQIAYARQQNDADVARLGLKSGDPESVIRAFKAIAASDPNANKRLVAKLLLENQSYIRQVGFSLDESVLEYAGGFIRASNGQPMVSINLDGHNGRGLADVLLHEYIHAFVSIMVATPSANLTPSQRGSLQRINGILELARRSAADKGITDPTLLDGLENVNEFVTYFFTSTDFQGFLKALLPPAKQRGFFSRMVDALLDMLRLSGAKQLTYQQAFTDIVDLTREAVLRTPMNIKAIANRVAVPASLTLQDVAEASRVIRSATVPSQAAADAQAARPTRRRVAKVDQETTTLDDAVVPRDMVPVTEGTPEITAAKVRNAIKVARRLVPPEIGFEINTDIPYAAAFQGGKIMINPVRLSSVVGELDPVSAQGVIGGIMSEESAHAASYNALSPAEINRYIETLKISDYDSIIDTYYQTEEAKTGAKARVRSEVGSEAQVERELLAEEKLRMHGQKVTRGYTTEEDVMFWRSKPGLFRILGRYMKGFLKRYTSGRDIRRLNGVQRVTVQRLVTEIRAINAGYRITPNALPFDPANPFATISRVADQLNQPGEMTENQVVKTQFGTDTMATVDPVAVRSETVAGLEVGTRNPTAKGKENSGFDPSMVVDLATLRENPRAFRKNAILLVTYPIVARELRLAGKGGLVDQVRALSNKVTKASDRIAKIKEEIPNADKELKKAVSESRRVPASSLRKYDIRTAIAEAERAHAANLEANPKARPNALVRAANKRKAISNRIKELNKEKKRLKDESTKERTAFSMDDKKFSMADAESAYETLIRSTESNLTTLMQLFPKDIRELARLWYDGANRIAQRLGKASNSSVEQAAGVLAVFSPQKDWYMNVSLAERMMKFYTENQDATFDPKMVDRFYLRAGEPEITGYDANERPTYQGKAIPLMDADGQPVYDAAGRQRFTNWDSEKAEANLEEAELFISLVRGKKFTDLTSIDIGRKKPLSKEAVQARFIRMFSEVYDSAIFPVVTPDGRTLGPSLTTKGEPIRIGWGGYNTIEKAIRIMSAKGTPEQVVRLISNEVGDMHKVRSFYNNIVSPQSARGNVTMDTHAVAALYWRALSGGSLEVTQNFSGAGTSKDSTRGLVGLYAANAEAYRRVAANKDFGLLPREIQSITWEAVRLLFPAKWKGNKNNVNAVNNVWADYEYGRIELKDAHDLIFRLSPASNGRSLEQAIADGEGVGRPDWAKITDGSDDRRVYFEEGPSDVPLIDRGFTRPVREDPEQSGSSLVGSQLGVSDIRSNFESFRFAQSKQITAGAPVNASYFNFTVMSDRVKAISDLATKGDFKAVTNTTIAVVRHALSDLPQSRLGLNIEEVTGVWEGQTEPALRIYVTAEGALLDKVRSRMVAISEMFDQDEVHEYRQLTSEESTNINYGDIGNDKSSSQPYFKIILDGPAVWDTLEPARAEAGISGASFSGNEIFLYSTEGDYDSFLKKVNTFTNKINESQRVLETLTGGIRLNRYSREAGQPNSRGYSEVGLRVPAATTRIGNDLILNILKHTGGRLPAPVSRSLFTADQLTQEEIELQMDLADNFDALPFDDSGNADVVKAYERAASYIDRQWADIIEGKIDIEVIPFKRIENGVEVQGDLYASSRDVVNDIRNNGRLRVLQTTPEAFGPAGVDFSGHPFLKVSRYSAKVMDAKTGVFTVRPILINDAFRAVHDVIAHGLFSDPFGPIGEEGARRAHMATIDDPWAKWAVTQETRAQNSSVNYGQRVRGADGRVIMNPNAPGFLPVKERGFASQKYALSPLEYSFTGIPEIDAPLKELLAEIGPDRARGSSRVSSSDTTDAPRTVGSQFGSEIDNEYLNLAKDPEKNREALQKIQQRYTPKTDEEQRSFDRASTNKVLARSPQLAVAAVRMKNGEITADEYANLVDSIDPFVPKGADPIPTDEKIKQYIQSDKVGKVGLLDENGNPRLQDGSEYEFRIDINTYNRSTAAGDTVYNITAHLPVSDTSKNIGEVAAFTGIAKVIDPRFMTRDVREGGAITIAMGAGKFRLATVKGKYEPITELPADINDPNVWTEVSYNPVRSSFFVDTRSKQAAIGGTEAIMVGSRVFVKDAKLEARPTGTTMGTRYTQYGSGSMIPVELDVDSIDFSEFLETLEIPVMEIGTYQGPSGTMDKIFRGELDPRVTRLKNQRDFFTKASMDLARRYKAKLDQIIERDFGGIESAPIELIQDATGSTEGIVIPQDIVNDIEDRFTYDLDVIDTDETLTSDERVAARDAAMVSRKAMLADAEKRVAVSIRANRDRALAELAESSPELVRHIVEVRKLTDELSKKVTEVYGFPPELRARFDNQLGIYLTRTYRMFDEVGYGDKVLNDPDYDTIRETAVRFFEEQYVASEVSRRIVSEPSVTRAQAEADARAEVSRKGMGGRTYGQAALEEFVAGYDRTGSPAATAGMSRSLQPLLDNIRNKQDLPKPIRDLLGEKGSEVGADNLIRSLITVSTMAANQSFLNHVRDLGQAGGWLLNAEQLKEARVRDYDKYKGYKSIKENETSSYDPLGGLYGPPEMVEGFRKVFSPDSSGTNQTKAAEIANGTIKIATKLTGGAMALKTLGSIGFYIRNVASNMLFFGPSQGFVNLKSMSQSAAKEIWGNALRDPNALDAYRSELMALGIIGEDINTNIMSAMLRGGTPDDIETQLESLIDTANKGLKPLTWLSNRAQILSQSVDSFYKIAYFENELRVLKEARSVDTGSLSSMTDKQLKRIAADKVLATAQSASQAPPIVRQFTSSGFGLLFAPFVRFKAEVPRIVLNTYRVAWSEMSSSNPVLKRRGIARFAGMNLMLGGVSALGPAILAFAQGIGEDEDEALRKSIPEYLRNHTFFYRRKANGQLQSLDLTFLNPFSIIMDPVTRSLEHVFRGEPGAAAAKFVDAAIFSQYLDDQILSGAVQSLRDNVNPSTGRPIYESQLDGFGGSLIKSMSFVLKEAYQPSVLKRAIASYEAIGGDYTDFDDSPLGIIIREVYPVKPHDIELDKQLRRYLSETREVYNRVGSRKNALLSGKAMSSEDVRKVIESEIEDKLKINEDVYRTLRGFEGLGLAPQDLYQITTGSGYGKQRMKLLFNQTMDRPTLSPDFIEKLSNPENEQGLERLNTAMEVLRGTPRYILLEP